jgi:hypothetical protein
MITLPVLSACLRTAANFCLASENEYTCIQTSIISILSLRADAFSSLSNASREKEKNGV